MISMEAAAPVDREVTVTVSLVFPESQLRSWEESSLLGQRLSEEFRVAVKMGKGNNSAYKALYNLT